MGDGLGMGVFWVACVVGRLWACFGQTSAVFIGRFGLCTKNGAERTPRELQRRPTLRSFPGPR
eukprot:9978939-Alexandrium_andersonii.AAC.1